MEHLFFVLVLCMMFSLIDSGSDHVHDVEALPRQLLQTHRQSRYTGNGGCCSLLHSTQSRARFTLLATDGQTDRQMDGLMLPSTLSPCFPKATWSIKMNVCEIGVIAHVSLKSQHRLLIVLLPRSWKVARLHFRFVVHKAIDMASSQCMSHTE